MSTSLTVDLFVSVDGFAGSDGLPGYFGYFGPDLRSWIAAESAAPHMVLMGRRTYEVLASLPEEHRDESWQAMARLPTVVFSRTLTGVDWPGARLCGNDAVEEVARLKLSGNVPRLRTTGSLSLVQQLIAAGLVDRLRLVTFPLLAGAAGREPAFFEAASTELRLVDTRILDARIHLVEYAPTDRGIPRGTEQREPAPHR
ncbi:MAG: dihydrofolate reductase family protein [Actinomycetota bacterium]|nr:dihydrofolate reductase family protein [Actinomycetota bacterium]